MEDSGHDVFVTTELPAAFVEVLPRRGGAEEHLGRDPVVDRPAPRLPHIEVVVGQSGVFVVFGEVLWKRIARDRLLGGLREIDVTSHILDLPPVVHASEEELLGVTEDDGTDA